MYPCLLNLLARFGSRILSKSTQLAIAKAMNCQSENFAPSDDTCGDLPSSTLPVIKSSDGHSDTNSRMLNEMVTFGPSNLVVLQHEEEAHDEDKIDTGLIVFLTVQSGSVYVAIAYTLVAMASSSCTPKSLLGVYT